MEDVIVKSVELGALGIANILLITRGIQALNNLTKSIELLTEKVLKLDKTSSNF